MSFVTTDKFSVRVIKITSRIHKDSHELTAYLSIFNLFKLKELWRYYQKYFSVIIPRCYKDIYVNSFFSRSGRLWSSLPIECFPLTYYLSGFTS